MSTSEGITSVAGVAGLPAEGSHVCYVVSRSDPRYIIAGMSGRVFVRDDGENWGGDGWTVRVTAGVRSEAPATAKLD